MSHHRYDNWRDNKVEIGLHCLQCLIQAVFGVLGEDNFYLVSTQVCVCFVSVHAIHSTLTIQMSHHRYAKWRDKVEIGLHCLYLSTQADVSVGGLYDMRWLCKLLLFY